MVASPPMFLMRAGVVFRIDPRVSRVRIVTDLSTTKASDNAGIVWEIEAVDDPLRIGKLTYGEVPPGFSQIHPAEGPPGDLQPGGVYRIFVWGPDGFGRDKFDWRGAPTYERGWLERVL